MKKEYKAHIKKCILRLQEQTVNCQAIYKYGIDLINYESGISSCIEESISLMCSNNDKEFEWALEILQWWLYENVDKKIWDSTTNEILYDLNDIDNFVDYLTDKIEP